LGDEIIYDHGDPNDFPGSRGVKHVVKSRCILMCLLDTPAGLIRVVTTHFTVSDLCTETSQMYEMACLTASLIDNAKSYPTIFSGDLNIRAKSYSVSKLSEVMTCHTNEFTDTLAKDHISKEKDFPEGLAIDHVFSKDMDLVDINANDVSFSEHKALVSNFSLNTDLL
ncbi:hypothetical protein KC909_06415, partial [Candidatus Dojkabacteria bacterium]|nr:hypothetical protein [Candidatus Dojkabacteria bacterium]